jgi:hypothetical protein
MTDDSSKPLIMRIEGWQGRGRGIVILGWSEMDRGPVPDLNQDHGKLVGDGLRDVTGTLVGGLYAEDYARAIDDYGAGRDAPRLTTASYDLGRAKASEDAAAARELVERLRHESDERGRAVRAMLPPEAQADFDRQMEDIRSGAYEARAQWAALSTLQQSVLQEVAVPGARLRRRGDGPWLDVVADSGGITVFPAGSPVL